MNDADGNTEKLKKLFREYASSRLSIDEWEKTEIEQDQKLVGSLRDGSSETREDLRHWLHRYGVLRWYPTKTDEILLTITKFAQANAPDEKIQVVELHSELEDGLSKASGSAHCDSLASKALWLCFPDQVPILDANAERAVRALAATLGLKGHRGTKRYEQFVEIWKQIYELLEPEIDDAAVVAAGGWKVRVFDRFLWALGDPQRCIEWLIEKTDCTGD